MNFINSIANNSNFALFSANFWWTFFRISRQIPENSDVCRFFNQICENKSEICRKFWILWKKKFTIIQNNSLHSLVRTTALPHPIPNRRAPQERWVVGDKVRVVANFRTSERLRERAVVVVPAELHLGDLYAESGQTLQGSFSAVSILQVYIKY